MALIRRPNDWMSPMMKNWFDDIDLWSDEDWSMSRNLQVEETEDEVKVMAPVYGVDPEDVKVNVQGNVLTIRGESKKEEDKKDKKGKKTSSYKMQRSFDYYYTLPARVISDTAAAKVKNGVVTVTLPKSEEEKGRSIEVKAG